MNSFNSLAVLIIAAIFLVSCGKKSENVSSRAIDRLPQTEINTYLEKQSINCENNQACPSFIAKIVVADGASYKFCTGFLTDDDIVATSSSCLPRILRLNGQDCSKDVHFYFPRTTTRPAERVGCSKVELVSSLEGNDPILWRDDVAFLKISKSLDYRRHARIIRDGVQNKKQFTSWMIDQQDEYSAIIKKQTCESVHDSYLSPLVNTEFSPNMLFVDCPITSGGKGSPVLDSRGKVRAIITQPIDMKLRLYLESTGLLTQGLKEAVHASNFACAPTIDDDDLTDEKECLKDLNYTKIDRIRSEMISTNNLFIQLKKDYEAELSKLNRYISFGVKVIPQGDIHETEVFPNCFKNLSDWVLIFGRRNYYVQEITIPKKSFKRIMDPYGIISSMVVDVPTEPTIVQFSLKSLRLTRKSSILTWPKSNRDQITTFPEISERCSESLF